jgi:methylmalonyl-CoA mutase cobalamin-binding domain/chain
MSDEKGVFAGHVDLRALLPDELPDGRDTVAEGVALGRDVERQRSMFLQEKGVESERAWRERAREQGILCTCMNIGLSTWADTREALGLIYEDALSRGVRPPDRFNLLAERRMGLPKGMRADAPQETGPVLWTEQDWWELAHTVPIQPEAADNMIGGPGSLDNVLDALHVGITHIGVLSQYCWRWPYWDDEVTQTVNVLRAAGALAAWRREGVCFDSYLEDGYPGVFHDYANYVGWAMVERYISEELIGAAYSCSWGGLTQNPVTKSAVTLALHEVNPDRVPAGFVQGDTIGYTPDFDGNMAVLATDVLFMRMVDARYKLGGAPIAVPVTEAARIPSWDEVATAQTVSRRLEPYVPLVESVVDWRQIEALRDTLVAGGRRFFAAAMRGLADSGIDVRDPAQILLVLKRLGADRCEELFGAGEPDESYLRGRRPVLQTDLVRDTIARRDALLAELARRGPIDSLRGRRVLVSSTDVHEFAEFLLSSTLSNAGAAVTDFGINRDPEDIVKVAIEIDAEALVITTHNGVARSFAQRLTEELARAGLADRPVFMGGVLNEDIEGSDVPIEVRADLLALGVQLPDTIEQLVVDLASRVQDPSAAQ